MNTKHNIIKELKLVIRNTTSNPRRKQESARGVTPTAPKIGMRILWNGMEYVIGAKGPALGLVRSFSADRRRREKRNKIEQEECIQQN